MFGGSIQPQYQIVDVQWKQMSEDINFRPKVVDTLSYMNNYSYPVDQIFLFSWNTEEEQRTTWSKQWDSEECHMMSIKQKFPTQKFL